MGVRGLLPQTTGIFWGTEAGLRAEKVVENRFADGNHLGRHGPSGFICGNCEVLVGPASFAGCHCSLVLGASPSLRADSTLPLIPTPHPP